MGYLPNFSGREIGEVILVPTNWYLPPSILNNYVELGAPFNLSSYPLLGQAFPQYKNANNFVNWFSRNTTNATPLFGSSIAFGTNGTVVVINQQATGNNLLTSLDYGVTWTAYSAGGSLLPLSVMYIPWLGLFVVTGTGSPYVGWSSDGITWNAGTNATVGCGAIAHNDTNTVIISSWTSGTGYSSTDGKAWTARTQYGSTCTFQAAGWNGNVFLLAGGNTDTNITSTSPNGISWTTRTGPVTKWGRQIYNNNGTFFYLAQNYGYIASSTTDGTSWTAQAYTLPAADPRWLTKVQDTWVLVGGTTTSYIYTSFDLTNWTKQTAPSDSVTGYNAAVATDGKYCLVLNRNAASGPAIMNTYGYLPPGYGTTNYITPPTGYKYMIRAK